MPQPNESPDKRLTTLTVPTRQLESLQHALRFAHSSANKAVAYVDTKMLELGRRDMTAASPAAKEELDQELGMLMDLRAQRLDESRAALVLMNQIKRLI